MSEDKYSLCFLWFNVSSEWNSLCFVHNFKDFVLDITLNGVQMVSEKKQLASNFMEKLTKPFSVGLETPFWGQITDFNIWNRPLSNEEVHQFSFGCQEGLSNQPEILDWSTVNITERRINSDQFQMQRQLFPCQYGMTQSQMLLENANGMNYYESTVFCNLLKGDLFDPTNKELSQVDIQPSILHWVPIVNSNSGLIFDTPVGNSTHNSTLTTGRKTDECMCASITSNKKIPKKCKSLYSSICKVPTHFFNTVETTVWYHYVRNSKFYLY
jgi:hypothetical protein